jgi:hypothetical protein
LLFFIQVISLTIVIYRQEKSIPGVHVVLVAPILLVMAHATVTSLDADLSHSMSLKVGITSFATARTQPTLLSATGLTET